MTKVGRFITDPKAGAYCQIVLDSGDKLVVNHDKGGFKGGRVVIETSKWWGGGQRVFSCDLDSAEGKAMLAKLTQGAAEGTVQATPLGALVEHIKDCRSVDEVKTRCGALMAG
jgi:hypothetical protein